MIPIKMNLDYLKLPLILSALALMWSCKKEGGPGEGQKESFLKFYGTSSYDQGFDLKQTADGGYVILGNTTVAGRGTDISLMKTDAFGNLEWKRTYGGLGADEGSSFQITDDGGFIITGFMTNVDTAGEELDRDVCLIRTNSLGLETWANPVLIGSPDANEEGKGVLIMNNGFFIGGIIDSINPKLDYASELLAYRTDFNGNLNSNAVSKGRPGNEFVNHIVQIGQVVIYLGNTQSGNTNLNTPNVFMAKFDPSDQANGFIDAEYNLSITNRTENAIFGIEDEGYLILLNNLSFGGSSTIQVVKFEFGQFTNTAIWNESYEIDKKETQANAIAKANDGGYIISGTIEATNGDRDLFILKIASDGAQQWYKIFGSDRQNEQGENVIQTTDGGYLTLGTSGLSSDGSRIRNSLITLVKTTAEGELK